MDWILASGSPRRRELLARLNIEFRIVKPDVEELDTEEYDPKKLVLHNARLKSDFVRAGNPDSCILSSDTTVALGRRIFNKPKNFENGVEMLSELSGKTHSVFTSVVFRHKEFYWDYIEESRVSFKKLCREEIIAYLKKVYCLDKAGSYAIQEGREFIIEKFNGTLENIMGFPIREIENKLKDSGYLKRDVH